MAMRWLLGGAAVAAALCAAAAASAATVERTFTFEDANKSVVAFGSFSYDSSYSGLLTYGELESFSVSLLGSTYDLAFVQGLASPDDYVYFGYDTATNTFVPASIQGYTDSSGNNLYSGILAGVGYSPNTGFFFDPLVGQADPAGTGADGVLASYGPEYPGGYNAATAVNYSVVPEASTWALMGLGFAGLGFAGWRKVRSTRAVDV